MAGPRDAAASPERRAYLRELVGHLRYKPEWSFQITDESEASSEYGGLPPGWLPGQMMVEILYPSPPSPRPQGWAWTLDPDRHGALFDDSVTQTEVAEAVRELVWRGVLRIETDEFRRNARERGRPSLVAMRLAADLDSALPLPDD